MHNEKCFDLRLKDVKVSLYAINIEKLLEIVEEV